MNANVKFMQCRKLSCLTVNTNAYKYIIVTNMILFLSSVVENFHYFLFD